MDRKKAASELVKLAKTLMSYEHKTERDLQDYIEDMQEQGSKKFIREMHWVDSDDFERLVFKCNFKKLAQLYSMVYPGGRAKLRNTKDGVYITDSNFVSEGEVNSRFDNRLIQYWPTKQSALISLANLQDNLSYDLYDLMKVKPTSRGQSKRQHEIMKVIL